MIDWDKWGEWFLAFNIYGALICLLIWIINKIHPFL